MKFIIATAAVVLAATGVPAAQSVGTSTQSSGTETKDRLPPERMEQLVAGPMSVFRKSGLAAAQKDFETLLAGALKEHGKASVEAADLLTSFGVQLYIESVDQGDSAAAEASLEYLKRAIPAYRAAFGPRDPEVALALNSYADALVQVKGDVARADAKAALEEAYSIRAATLGADNPETKEAADKLAQLNDTSRSFTAENDAANAITTAIATVQATVPLSSETLTGAGAKDGGFWEPGMYFDPLVDDFTSDVKKLAKADVASRASIAAKYRLTPPALDATIAFLREMDKEGYDESRRSQLRKDALHVVQVSNRAPIALMFAAGALDQLADGACRPEDAAELMTPASPSTSLMSYPPRRACR